MMLSENSLSDSVNILELFASPPTRLSYVQLKALKQKAPDDYKFMLSIKGLSFSEKVNTTLKKHLKSIRNSIENIHPLFLPTEFETITYFKSRGVDCGREAELVVGYLDGEQMDELYYREIGYKNDKKFTIKEAEKHKPLSTPLQNFWRSEDYDKYNEDAYYLRFIDWCDISDFDEIWINRVIEEYKQLAVLPVIPTETLGDLLFNHCRSDYSIKLLRDSIFNLLEEYESRILDDVESVIKVKTNEINYITIAIILFANCRLNTVKPKIIKKCISILKNSQNANGGWSINNKKKDSDVLTTAIVIHALVISKYPNFATVLNPSIEWIKHKQNVFGIWSSKMLSPRPLTVLILDAIDMAQGKTNVTFLYDKEPVKPKFKFVKKEAKGLLRNLEDDNYGINDYDSRIIEHNSFKRFKSEHVTYLRGDSFITAFEKLEIQTKLSYDEFFEITKPPSEWFQKHFINSFNSHCNNWKTGMFYYRCENKEYGMDREFIVDGETKKGFILLKK